MPELALYPLTPAQIAQAVNNSGYLNYKWRDFSHNLECESVKVNEKGRACACYTFSYFDDNEDRVMQGRIFVYAQSEQGERGLYADW